MEDETPKEGAIIDLKLRFKALLENSSLANEEKLALSSEMLKIIFADLKEEEL